MAKYTRRKDGRYATTISTGKYTDDGKPIRKKIYAKTIKELDALANEMRYEIKHGTYAYGNNVTFDKYADHWLDVAKDTKSIRTKAMYKNIVDNHTSLLSGIRMKDITKSALQSQVNACKDMPRICQQLNLTLRQIFDFAIDDGLLVRNPCKDLDLPVSMPKENRQLTKIEKEALKNCEFTAREKAFIYLFYGCGLRPGEAFALTRGDIDLKNKEITINKALEFDGQKPLVKYPKTKSGIRTMQAPDFVFNALSEYMQGLSCLILFPRENGQYGTRSYYYNIFTVIRRKIESYTGRKAIRDSGETKLTMYTFRHNYCTELYYSGISLKECQRLMGHSDYSMIMKVYAHLDEQKENTKEKLKSLAL